MSETYNKSKQVAVGIFIFIGLVIMVFAILTIGGQHKTFVKTVAIKSIFDNVSGLQAGNNIWLSGVKIGTVKKVQFSGQSQVEVTMHIEEHARPYVRKDSRARISSDGLVGNKIIELSAGTAAAGPISEGDYLGSERGVSAQEMAATLQANNKNLLEITTDFKTISRKLTGGEGTIGALINDNALAGKMRSAIANLNILSVKSEKVIADLATYTAGLNKPGAFANQLVTDTTIFAHLRGTVSELRDAAAAANSFSEKLNTAGNGLTQTNTPVGLLLHDQDVAADMKTTIRNFQTSSQKLNDDLEAVQHNFLLRGFFRKRAKANAKKSAAAPSASTSVPAVSTTTDSLSAPVN